MEKNPSVKKTILKNGKRVVTGYMPYLHSVSMGIWINVGARDETVQENGLSHFIEHMIFKGTSKRTSFDISKEFDAIGGYTNAFTAMETTCYHAKVLDSHLEIMVDILSDILLNSVFDEKEVERERAVIFQEIGMLEDNPDEYIHFLSTHHYWGDNSLGRSILGSKENILQFNSKKIKEFFRRLYQPERIVIAAAGNLDHDRFVDLVGPTFEAILPGNSFPDRIAPVAHAQVKLHHKNLEQVQICLLTEGLFTTAPERYILSIMNTIFGGNMSSRLFQKIREHHGLAYSVYSYAISHNETGLYGVYAGVNPSNSLKTIELVSKEIQKLKREKVNSDELRRAKEYTKGSLLLGFESNDNCMYRLAQNEIHFGHHIPLDDIMDKVESVTRDDILALSRQIFQSDNMALTLLGPVKDQAAFREVLAV